MASDRSENGNREPLVFRVERSQATPSKGSGRLEGRRGLGTSYANYATRTTSFVTRLTTPVRLHCPVVLPALAVSIHRLAGCGRSLQAQFLRSKLGSSNLRQIEACQLKFSSYQDKCNNALASGAVERNRTQHLVIVVLPEECNMSQVTCHVNHNRAGSILASMP